MRSDLYIDGLWCPAEAGGTLEVVHPPTERVFATVAAGTASDVDKTVRAARRALDAGPWPRLRGAERARALRQVAAIIRTRGTTSRSGGAGQRQAPSRGLLGHRRRSGLFDFYAGLADDHR